MKNDTDIVWYKRGLGLVVICILLSVVVSQFDLFSEFNEAWIDRDIRNSGWHGAMYFMAVGILMTACGAPRQLLAFLGGYAFGVSLGFIYSMIATVLGCICAFYVSKLIFRPIIRRKFNEQSIYINRLLTKSATRKTIIIRLLPVGSNVLTNLIAGTTSVNPKNFFVGSAIGYMPQMLVFSLLGKGLVIGSEWKIALSIALLLISSFLSVNLYKKYRVNVTDPQPVHLNSSIQSKQ